jgi:hypothetical protein
LKVEKTKERKLDVMEGEFNKEGMLENQGENEEEVEEVEIEEKIEDYAVYMDVLKRYAFARPETEVIDTRITEVTYIKSYVA